MMAVALAANLQSSAPEHHFVIPVPALSASSLPPLMKNPYTNTPDPLLSAQSWSANDPWGVYSGTAFCHDLCNFAGNCGGLTNKSMVIESPLAVTLAGEDDNVMGGSINFNWQAKQFNHHRTFRR